MAPIITLLTDFGGQDSYVGVMKGVIASICPAARLIDLTHEIPPQNIAEARFNLLNAYPYFPQGTVHLVVVDPGVGTERRTIALQTPRGYLVGPDNGVLSGILETESEIAAVHLTNQEYWRSPHPSNTFHGRDIFAPVAAHLASGVALAQLGDEIDPTALVLFPIPEPKITADQVTGHVQHVDHFGNLVTTIPASVTQQQAWIIRIGATTVPIGQAYGEAEPGAAIALVGSHDYLEIAINGGSARADLNLTVGDAIQLSRQS
jgi:S-adenosylmethionine hydrolase